MKENLIALFQQHSLFFRVLGLHAGNMWLKKVGGGAGGRVLVYVNEDVSSRMISIRACPKFYRLIWISVESQSEVEYCFKTESGMIEESTSDHHMLIFSFLKTSFTKMPRNKLCYRKYKSFDKIGQTYLKKQITQNGKISSSEHTQLKSKVIRGSKSFVTKTLRKTIMRRSALTIQWGLIFANVIRCCGRILWVGYFIYFKFTRVFLTHFMPPISFDTFSGGIKRDQWHEMG